MKPLPSTTSIISRDKIGTPYLSYSLSTNGDKIIAFTCRKGNAFFTGRLMNKEYMFSAPGERPFKLPQEIKKEFAEKGKFIR